MRKLIHCLLFLTLLTASGCGSTNQPVQNQFMINQNSGIYGTAYNGQLLRTRSYEGIRQYHQDNVAIIVTDQNGKSNTLYTRYTESFRQ